MQKAQILTRYIFKRESLICESFTSLTRINTGIHETMLNSYNCIKSIERIQNQRWYKQYAAHRKAMNERFKQENEKQLFHGFNKKSADSIVEECFNRSYAGINGKFINYLLIYIKLLIRYALWKGCLFRNKC